jgi:uncharacterized protein
VADSFVSLLGIGKYTAFSILTVTVSAFVAGLARGFSGFGSALIFAPLASICINPVLVAPLLLITDAFPSLGLLPNAWRNADRKEVGIMALGAVLGVPVGTWILMHAEPVTIRWMIVAAILPALVLLVSGWRYHGQPGTLSTLGVGLLSGVFSGLAQIGGPPIVLYWLGGQRQTGVVRANIILFFAASIAVAFFVYGINGLLTSAILGLLVVTVPIYSCGLWIGTQMFGVAVDVVFRKICYTLIGVAVLISLPVLDKLIR